MSSRIFPLLFVLLFAGCLPESKNPIAPPSLTIADQRLEGVWEAKDDKTVAYYHMIRRTERGTPWLDVLEVSPRENNGGAKFGGYTALSAKIGPNRFLSFKNSKFASTATPPGAFSFARYDFSWNGDLRLWLVSDEALAKAIHAGRLHGEVKRTRYTTSVTLTDSSTRLAEFFSGPNTDQFFNGKPMALHRVRHR